MKETPPTIKRVAVVLVTYILRNRKSSCKNTAKLNALDYDFKRPDGYSYVREGNTMGFYLEHILRYIFLILPYSILQ